MQTRVGNSARYSRILYLSSLLLAYLLLLGNFASYTGGRALASIL